MASVNGNNAQQNRATSMEKTYVLWPGEKQIVEQRFFLCNLNSC